MAFVCVDKDGTELGFFKHPERTDKEWVCAEDDMENGKIFPKGVIRKLIGRELTWEDEPCELKEE